MSDFGARIGEDPPFQHRMWLAERTSWAAMASFVAAALLGLFGDGPLTGARAAAPDGSLAVAWPQFARLEAEARIEVTLARGATLRIGGDLDAVRLEAITPAPESERREGGALTLRFDTAGAPASVRLHLRPLRPFRTARLTLQAEGGAAVEAAVFVFP